jgi:predicted RNase H-like nuclease (RuvC/YqgF family)
LKTWKDEMKKEEIKRADETLLEMISNNEELNEKNIQIILLRSQHSHLYNLENKLNEVTGSVKQLEKRFDNLEHKFETLETKFENLELKVDQKFKAFEHRIESLETKFDQKFETLEQKFETQKIEVKNEINQAIITQTKWLISGAGILVISMKFLDIFVK